MTGPHEGRAPLDDGLAGQYAAARLTDRHQRWLRLLEALVASEPHALAALPEPRHVEQLQNSLNNQPIWQTVPRDAIATSRQLSPFGAHPAVATATLLARLAEAMAEPPAGDSPARQARSQQLIQQAVAHLARTGLAAPGRPSAAPPAEALPAAGGPEPTPHRFLAELGRQPLTSETGDLRLLALELVDEVPAVERTVTEPVVFHKDTLGRSGNLTLKLLRSGPAGIYPDPAVMAFLNPDRGFLDSLRQAAAALPPRLEGRCVLWSLTSEHHDPVNNVTGPSVGATFAVALASLAAPVPWRAVANQVGARYPRLVRRTAITAQLVGPKLSPVTGHQHKIDAARDAGVDLLVDAESFHSGKVDGQPLRQHARTRAVALRGAQTLEQARRRSRPRPTAGTLAALGLVLVLLLLPLGLGRLRAEGTEVAAVPVTSSAPAPSPRPVPSGPLVVDGEFGRATCAALQRALNAHHGADLDVDGVCGPLTVSALQHALGVPVNGTRDKATIKALQRRLGAEADGDWGSDTTRRLQERLNADRF